jgi:hypothetical protein
MAKPGASLPPREERRRARRQPRLSPLAHPERRRAGRAGQHLQPPPQRRVRIRWRPIRPVLERNIHGCPRTARCPSRRPPAVRSPKPATQPAMTRQARPRPPGLGRIAKQRPSRLRQANPQALPTPQPSSGRPGPLPPRRRLVVSSPRTRSQRQPEGRPFSPLRWLWGPDGALAPQPSRHRCYASRRQLRAQCAAPLRAPAPGPRAVSRRLPFPIARFPRPVQPPPLSRRQRNACPGPDRSRPRQPGT